MPEKPARKINWIILPEIPPKKEFSEILSDAWTILSMAKDSSQSFFITYSIRRFIDKDAREMSPKGTTSDVDQDHLRAALVFSCAGLDSMLKQLVRDCLPWLIRQKTQLADMLKAKLAEWARRRMRDEITSISEPEPDGRSIRKETELLRALAISSDAPIHTTVELCVEDLTGDSLQSTSQLKRVLSLLGIEQLNVSKLKEAFDARNQIIHEMDVNLKAKTRNRHQRKQRAMLELTKTVFAISVKVLKEVDAVIKQASES